MIIREKYSKDVFIADFTKYAGGEINEVGNLCIIGHNYKM